MFNDTVNRMMPRHHRELGLKVSTSNLCSEITLPTGRDHLGNDRTAVCCLSSLNLETWEELRVDRGKNDKWRIRRKQINPNAMRKLPSTLPPVSNASAERSSLEPLLALERFEG